MPARDVQCECDVTSKSDVSGPILSFFESDFATFASKLGDFFKFNSINSRLEYLIMKRCILFIALFINPQPLSALELKLWG